MYLNDHAIKGYKLIDANVLQELFNAYSKCEHCEKEKCLYLFQRNTSRRGMLEKILCEMCVMSKNI